MVSRPSPGSGDCAGQQRRPPGKDGRPGPRDVTQPRDLGRALPEDHSGASPRPASPGPYAP